MLTIIAFLTFGLSESATRCNIVRLLVEDGLELSQFLTLTLVVVCETFVLVLKKGTKGSRRMSESFIYLPAVVLMFSILTDAGSAIC